MERLQDRVAVVTGSASGIGEAIAREYAAEGAKVVLVDVNEEGAERVLNEIESAGGEARFYGPVSVADCEQMQGMRDRVVEEFGRLDIMVNNAGICIYGDILESTYEDWQKVIQVDLDAVYLGSKLAAEVMVKQRAGRIISTASIQAFMTTSRCGAYNAAKAGVVGLTHSMAVELAPYNILVNAIAPGAIKTPMNLQETGEDKTETEEFRKAYLESGRIPLRRMGLPEDIAGAALFLASDDCRYLTGHTLVVDGGLSLTI